MIFENVSRLCKERGVTISEVERAIGIGNGCIGRWRISYPTVKNAKAVADYFGVSVDDLLREPEEEQDDAEKNSA